MNLKPFFLVIVLKSNREVVDHIVHKVYTKSKGVVTLEELKQETWAIAGPKFSKVGYPTNKVVNDIFQEVCDYIDRERQYRIQYRLIQ